MRKRDGRPFTGVSINIWNRATYWHALVKNEHYFEYSWHFMFWNAWLTSLLFYSVRGNANSMVVTIVNTVTQPVENCNSKLRIIRSMKFHACGPYIKVLTWSSRILLASLDFLAAWLLRRRLSKYFSSFSSGGMGLFSPRRRTSLSHGGGVNTADRISY
jgi:hypothetical protein